MSANGALTSTLDYSYIGGGVVRVSGTSSSDFVLAFDSTAVVPITGTIQPVTLDLTLSDAGVETPTIQASATNLSFGFTGSGTIEFGVQRYLTAPYGNIQTSFTANSQGYVVVSGTFDNTLEFSSDTHIYVFSEGPVAVDFGFEVSSVGINVSTHNYSKVGSNDIKFNAVDNNGLKFPSESNGIRLVTNGVGYAVVQN